ncbi:MAG: H-NS histone family protein [Hyphomicrobium sp.]|jgi:DNA-binding protein H-NS|nr:H-NS histone family protein [Hyphomicrobium sp.]
MHSALLSATRRKIKKLRFVPVKQSAKKSPAINLDKMSLKELVDLEARVQKAIAVLRDRERAALKEKMSELAKNHGFSVTELFGGVRGTRGAGKGKSIGVAKYANPENKADTWTGRGRKPNWLLERLKKGAKLNDFAI